VARHWPIRLVAVAVAYLVLLLVLRLIDGEVNWVEPLGPVGIGLVAGVVSEWWQRRRVGAQLLPGLTRAVRTGRLPEDADPELWRPLLQQELAAGRRLVVTLVLLLGGLVAVVLVLTAVLTAPWTPVLVAITLIALVGLVLWWAQRRRERRIDALLEQVAG
jgi:hypothetical protein